MKGDFDSHMIATKRKMLRGDHTPWRRMVAFGYLLCRLCHPSRQSRSRRKSTIFFRCCPRSREGSTEKKSCFFCGSGSGGRDGTVCRGGTRTQPSVARVYRERKATSEGIFPHNSEEKIRTELDYQGAERAKAVIFSQRAEGK